MFKAKLNISACFLAVCVTFLCLHSVWGDLIIESGGIVNKASGNLEVDLNNDGSSEITFTRQGRLGLGTVSPKSTLEISGSLGFNTELFTSSGNLSGNTIVLANTLSSNITLTLPVASSVKGRLYQIKKTSANNILHITSLGNIDTNSSYFLSTSTTSLPFIKLISSGTQWLILSKSND